MRNIFNNSVSSSDNVAGVGANPGEVRYVQEKDLRLLGLEDAARVAVLNGLGEHHRMIVGHGVAAELVWPGGQPSNPSGGIVYLIAVIKDTKGKVTYEGLEIAPGQSIDAIYHVYSYFCVTIQEEMEKARPGSQARFEFQQRDGN